MGWFSSSPSEPSTASDTTPQEVEHTPREQAMRSVLSARMRMMDEIDKVGAAMSKKTLALRRRTFQGGINCIDSCNGDPDVADRCIDDVQKDLSQVTDLATAFGEDVMKRVGECMENCMGNDKTAADWQAMEDSKYIERMKLVERCYDDQIPFIKGEGSRKWATQIDEVLNKSN
ncbi:hypothetical protein FOZ63_000944 [Perkinsus olseni]|uniref:Uncharacterized protein n=1 Tax=Perkinsus olseni TaxID=32597 RepID=A0A7J6RD98_PEROL|nr:hypothetical protein FOZ60_006320 [Perkinsus olseni]KAF4718352.1 hypothetical protein FOZ62_017234 [Perkinsus olseni]KAF4742274.1 hypothetical protein FOZ63_000944 [Perkinsus olseni]